MTIAWDQSFVSITNPVDSRHSISRVQLHHDATRDIVKTRAEPAAGHDRCSRLWRVEKQPLPAASELETSLRPRIYLVQIFAGDHSAARATGARLARSSYPIFRWARIRSAPGNRVWL